MDKTSKIMEAAVDLKNVLGKDLKYFHYYSSLKMCLLLQVELLGSYCMLLIEFDLREILNLDSHLTLLVTIALHLPTQL